MLANPNGLERAKKDAFRDSFKGFKPPSFATSPGVSSAAMWPAVSTQRGWMRVPMPSNA